VTLLLHSERPHKALSKGLTTAGGLTFPSVTRQASLKRANRRCGYLGDCDFHSHRPIGEAADRPKGRIAGGDFFSVKESEPNRLIIPGGFVRVQDLVSAHSLIVL
jgi:hypothetical protein